VSTNFKRSMIAQTSELVFEDIIVAGCPVLFMYFSRRLVPTLSHMIFSSVHVMANVSKHYSCVCDSLEVITDKTDKDADN